MEKREAMTIRVGVFGAGGRMGAEVCRTVVDDAELELVTAVDPLKAGIDLRQATGIDGVSLQLAAGPEALAASGATVAVDFTHHSAAMDNLRWCAANGVHAVVGTTGFSSVDLDELRSLFITSN